MLTRQSKKHHYLPVHYLNGFTDNEGLFFVYDKQENRIVPKPVKSRSIFFENNLNTVILKEDRSDFLEDLYTQTENQLWNSFDTIRKSRHTDQIKSLDKMHLYLFLLLLYWRLPSNIDETKRFSEKAFTPNSEIDYFQLKSKKEGGVSPEVVEEMRVSESFHKVIKLMLPFAPFFKNPAWSSQVIDWKFVYIETGESFFLAGDCPIITKSKNGDTADPLGEFIFPVSGNILLVNCKNTIKKELNPEFIIQADIAIIENAQRFVVCQNEAFLQKLVTHYRVYSQYGKTGAITPELFDMLSEEVATQ